MIDRRNLIMGLSCVAAGAAAYGLKPRHEVALLPKNEKLADLVPMTAGPWIGQDVSDPLALNGQEEGTLSARLYNQIVTRLYTNPAASTQIMTLLAYGARQSDDLQLHRPEVCYPAFGYTLAKNVPVGVPLGRAAAIPSRQIVVENEDGEQYVTYWTRLGEFIPQDGSQQREARFLNAFQGLIPDGVLCRFSLSADDAPAAWRATNSLVESLVMNMRPERRSILVGSERAQTLAPGSGLRAAQKSQS